MKKLLMLAMAVMLMCSPAFADDDVTRASNGRLVITTYAYDFSVSKSVTSTTTEGVTSYFARISMTDGATKKAHVGWEAAQVASTPSLTAVTDGVAYWVSAPQTSYLAAYTIAMNEAWKVGKVVQTANKLVTVDGIPCFSSKDGTTSIDLVTGNLPTTTWTP